VCKSSGKMAKGGGEIEGRVAARGCVCAQTRAHGLSSSALSLTGTRRALAARPASVAFLLNAAAPWCTLCASCEPFLVPRLPPPFSPLLPFYAIPSQT
jgi:hypothetical protein